MKQHENEYTSFWIKAFFIVVFIAAIALAVVR